MLDKIIRDILRALYIRKNKVLIRETLLNSSWAKILYKWNIQQNIIFFQNVIILILQANIDPPEQRGAVNFPM